MYLKPPMLSASFTPQGKKVQRRLEHILKNQNHKSGWLLPLLAMLLLMLGSLVACAPSLTEVVALPQPRQEETAQPEQEVPAQQEGYRSPLRNATEILGAYGTRVHPVTGVEAMHAGVDLSANEGDAVVAAAAGTVSAAEYTSAYGYCVTVVHENGQESFYGHLQKYCVETGNEVSAGQEIGCVGQTGFATAPHLHFEVRENGVTLDPTDIVS